MSDDKKKKNFWDGLASLGKAAIGKLFGIKKRTVASKNTNVAGSYLTSKETKILKLNEAGN